MSITALGNQTEITPNEAAHFKTLISSPWRVRRAALQLALETGYVSARGHGTSGDVSACGVGNCIKGTATEAVRLYSMYFEKLKALSEGRIL